MTSVVEICNIALSNIRAGSINSLTEGSLPAQQCNLKYDILRDQILRDAPWQFARKVRPLSLLSDVDIFNWSFAYQYPSDCLYINQLILNWEQFSSDQPGLASRNRVYRNSYLYGGGGYDDHLRGDFNRQIEYQVHNVNGNRVIAANDEELRIEYRARVTDPNLFDNQFIMGFSHLLAAELAIPLVGTEKGRQLRSDSLSIYNAYINAAVASNANEQFYPTPDSELILTRN